MDVSVVIPTYEHRQLVQRALGGVFAQERPADEIIVVDDGSTDGTVEALEPLAREGRIELIAQENRGVSAARNAGIAAARGDVVAFLDSDDRWLPDHLRVIEALFARHPEAVLATTGPDWGIGGRESIEESRLVDPFPQLFLRTVAGLPSATAGRREALAAVGGFNEALVAREDADLWSRLAFIGPVCVLRRKTIVRKRRPGSHTDVVRRAGRCLDDLEVSIRAVLRELARRSGTEELEARGRGMLHFVAGLRAVDAGHVDAARTELHRACELLPLLSDSPDMVRYYVLSQLPRAQEPAEQRRLLATIAAAWPNPWADTAQVMRAAAALAALRGGRPLSAARLLAAPGARTALVRPLGRFLAGAARRHGIRLGARSASGWPAARRHAR